jgi:hypothetical protein
MNDSDSTGVWISAAFFVVCGFLELGCAAFEIRPLSFWPAWEALGRSVPYFLLALGLWRRSALCRVTAIIYCLAAITTYVIILGLALSRAQLHYTASIVVQSAFQVPSSVLLIVYLRSNRAADVFIRPL